MSRYRRSRVEGSTYFFTLALADRQSALLVEEVGLLRVAVSHVLRRTPFRIDAWVVLPEHMHCMWTLPEGDADFSGRWRAIKKRFAKSLPITEARTLVQIQRSERGIWQRRFWEHVIRDERDYAAHLDYIHFNPVKHGLVQHVANWPYSTFHRAVKAGLYPADWGMAVDDASLIHPTEHGEP